MATKKTLDCGHNAKASRENPDICTTCWDEAGYENEHSDNDGHPGTPDNFSPHCPVCREQQASKVVGHAPVDGFRGRCSCGVFCHTFGTGDNRKLAVHIANEAKKLEQVDTTAPAAKARVEAATAKVMAKTPVVKTSSQNRKPKATPQVAEGAAGATPLGIAPKTDPKQEQAFEDLKAKSPSRRKSKNTTAPGAPGQPTSLYPSERPKSTHKRKAGYDVFGPDSLGF